MHYGFLMRTSEYCCDMRGMLGFLILFLLSKKPMNGQEIADEIANRKGERQAQELLSRIKKPSANGIHRDRRKGRQSNII